MLIAPSPKSQHATLNRRQPSQAWQGLAKHTRTQWTQDSRARHDTWDNAQEMEQHEANGCALGSMREAYGARRAARDAQARRRLKSRATSSLSLSHVTTSGLTIAAGAEIESWSAGGAAAPVARISGLVALTCGGTGSPRRSAICAASSSEISSTTSPLCSRHAICRSTAHRAPSPTSEPPKERATRHGREREREREGGQLG